MLYRFLKWLAALLLLLVLPLLAALWITIIGWNWARDSLQRMVLERTGRALVIGGDLQLSLGCPTPRLHALADRHFNRMTPSIAPQTVLEKRVFPEMTV